MTFYLAARYQRMEELRVYRDELRAMGHEVTSRWLDGNHEGPDESDPTNDDLRKWAIEDIQDIELAKHFVLFTGCEKSTGRNIEFGYALRADKTIHLIGPRESVFHHLQSVMVYANWETFKAAMK